MIRPGDTLLINESGSSAGKALSRSCTELSGHGTTKQTSRSFGCLKAAHGNSQRLYRRLLGYPVIPASRRLVWNTHTPVGLVTISRGGL